MALSQSWAGMNPPVPSLLVALSPLQGFSYPCTPSLRLPSPSHPGASLTIFSPPKQTDIPLSQATPWLQTLLVSLEAGWGKAAQGRQEKGLMGWVTLGTCRVMPPPVTGTPGATSSFNSSWLEIVRALPSSAHVQSSKKPTAGHDRGDGAAGGVEIMDSNN